jgi:hypothetical protein
LVVSHTDNKKKKCFFYCTNSINSSWESITIYMSGKKIDILYYAKKKNSFYCKNSMKLRRVHTARTRFFFSKCMNCIQSLSNSYSAHQLQTSKKRNLFSYCANWTKKRKKIFLLHELVGGLINIPQEKKMFFHCTNSIKSSWESITIYMSGKKIDNLYYAKKKKNHFTARIQWNCVVFILRELDFFLQNAWTVSKACQIHTQHINYRHQKKETFLIVPTVKTLFTAGIR